MADKIGHCQNCNEQFDYNIGECPNCEWDSESWQERGRYGLARPGVGYDPDEES